MRAYVPRRLRESFWPSELQERLLVVALADAAESARAWQELRPGFVLDEHEAGTFDLLPLVYQRLADAVPDEPLLERLKGVYRREWVRGNVLAERTKEVAATLAEAGVRGLFVEGAVLAERYYPARGLRPAWYVDVLVEEEAAQTAIAALTDSGWSPPPPGPPRQRWALTAADRSICVVRTSPAYDFVDRFDPPRSARILWEAEEHYELEGVGLSTLGPTDTVLVGCVAGARLREPRSLLWILDAVMILRTAVIDWQRLVEVAGSHGQSQRLHDALAYVATLPGAIVPTETLHALDAAPMTPRERLAHVLANRSLPAAGSLPELAARHLAATSGRSALGTALSFPDQLRAEWDTPSTWRLPGAAAQRLARRLRLLRPRA